MKYPSSYLTRSMVYLSVNHTLLYDKTDINGAEKIRWTKYNKANTWKASKTSYILFYVTDIEKH